MHNLQLATRNSQLATRNSQLHDSHPTRTLKGRGEGSLKEVEGWKGGQIREAKA